MSETPKFDDRELWRNINKLGQRAAKTETKLEDHFHICGERADNTLRAQVRIEKQVCMTTKRLNTIFKLLLIGLGGLVPMMLYITYHIAIGST